MINEPFATGNSPLHQADPAIKIIAALLLSLAVATGSALPKAISGLLFGLLLLAVAKPALPALGKRLLTVNLFILLLWITLPLTGGGEAVTIFGPLHLSDKGVALALLISFKTNAIFLILTSLITTSSILDLGHGLRRLHLPHKLILLLLSTYRYLGLIEEEYNTLRRSAALRCFSANTSIHSYRTHGYLIGMTLIRSYSRSQRIHKAMLMRGFQGEFPLLTVQTVRPADMLLLALLVIGCLGLMLSPLFW